MNTVSTDTVTWSFSTETCTALTRLVGAPIGMWGNCVDVRIGKGTGVGASFAGLTVLNYTPQHGRRVCLQTVPHTSSCLFEWHELNAETADDAPPTKNLTSVNLVAKGALRSIEVVTVEFKTWMKHRDTSRTYETLSLDIALNLHFADGDVVHLTTDFDSILGTIVVAPGRFDPAALEWEGLTHTVRSLQS